ncbi:MAG: hypothetical protein AAGE52_17990 [Myxococcota bacterium]
MRISSMAIALLSASSAAFTGVSSASAQSLIAQAEEAYLNVDFERTLELCQEALASGELSAERVTRVYELMGVASAANGDEERSRDSYIRMLALSPEAQVDTNLAPRLRSPFMEARGYWATRSERMNVEARLVRAQRGLRVLVTDPLGMGTEVRVLTRTAGELVPMTELRYNAEESRLVEVESLPDADRIEYVIQLLDEHGNRLVELGTEDEPRSVGRDVATGVGGGGSENDDDRGGIPVWVWAVVGGVLAASALTVGLYFGLRTEPVDLQSAVEFQ